jgi:hypothetical protein
LVTVEANQDLVESRLTAGLGSDPEFAEALAQPGGGDRPAGLHAGEQPIGGGGCADADVASAVPGQFGHEAGKGFGDVQVVSSEAEEDVPVAGGDLIPG